MKQCFSIGASKAQYMCIIVLQDDVAQIFSFFKATMKAGKLEFDFLLRGEAKSSLLEEKMSRFNWFLVLS